MAPRSRCASRVAVIVSSDLWKLKVFVVVLQIVFSMETQEAVRSRYLQVNKRLFFCNAFAPSDVADGIQSWSRIQPKVNIFWRIMLNY